MGQEGGQEVTHGQEHHLQQGPSLLQPGGGGKAARLSPPCHLQSPRPDPGTWFWGPGMEGRYRGSPEAQGDSASLPGSCPCRCPHAHSLRVGGHQAAVRQPRVRAATPHLSPGQLGHTCPVLIAGDKPLAWEA